MHSTKSEILALLKRLDGSTVDELASALKLAPMTIRQHLTALERDDLVLAEGVRRPAGRPHYLYRLTGDGHRRVADGYDRMLALLVAQVGRMDPADFEEASPDQRRARLFEKTASALAQRYLSEVRSLTGDEQPARIVALLKEYGGFAEWHALDGAFEVRDFNCVYRAAVGTVVACAWHETLLTAMLGADVRAAADTEDCAACCRYIIPGPTRLGVQ